jgi:hypothetical protein
MFSKRYMLVCVSHIICDYLTLNGLFDEFLAAYHQDDTIKIVLFGS